MKTVRDFTDLKRQFQEEIQGIVLTTNDLENIKDEVNNET